MPKRGNKLELYFITALTLFYLLLFIMSFYLSRIAGKVPKLICGIALVLCLFVFIKEFFTKKPTVENAVKTAEANQGVPFYKTLLILIVYTLGLLILGFPLSTLILLIFWPVMLGAKASWKSVAISLLSTGVLYIVFVQLFYVRLPVGILFTSIFK
ncbi:MAG: tripartite tricarboxylate transporter TctB family protein [Bacteroidota bacterium]